MSEQTIQRPPSVEDGGRAMLDWLREMRDHHPVHEDEQGIFQVFRYEDVRRVTSDPAIFSSDFSRIFPMTEADGLRGNLLAIDPPLHRTVRQLVSQAFTPRMVAGLEPRIAEVTGELLDAIEGTRFDLVESLAYPLPVIVIAEMLGVPAGDRALFRRWADQVLNRDDVDITDPDMIQKAKQDVAELDAYLLDHIRGRRQDPRHDLISTLIGSEVDGERLDDAELVSFTRLLLLAGHITTTMLLGNAMLCFHEHPGAAAQVRADRTLVPAAIEEVLRLRSPFTLVARITAVDTELCGVRIPENRIVMPWLLSANHDERQFPEPERFDLHRENNKQVAFGHGVHFCLGAPLARLEGRVALNGLFDRFADIRTADPSTVPFNRGQGMFGVRALPIDVGAATG